MIPWCTETSRGADGGEPEERLPTTLEKARSCSLENARLSVSSMSVEKVVNPASTPLPNTRSSTSSRGAAPSRRPNTKQPSTSTARVPQGNFVRRILPALLVVSAVCVALG